MILILEQLQPFFEDNYQKIHVREYAQLTNTSPPTASKTLQELHKQGLLKRLVDKQQHLYSANRDSLFKDLQRIYYKQQLQTIIQTIQEETHNPTIVLFGSLAQAETNKQSDVDLAVFTPTKKPLQLQHKTRTIQVFQHKSIDELPQELQKNILNGFQIAGYW